jgi:phosphohistidine phosphatase
MKTLILVRHAKSSWKDHDLKDFDRPLNERGKRDAPFMGALIKEKGILPDVLISSPAKRAITTAGLFAKKLSIAKNEIIENEKIYEASAGELIDIINAIDDTKSSAMIFGHNPGLTMVANYLSDKRIDNIPTCGMVVITFEENSWKSIQIGSGKLIEFEYPKKYFD